MPYELHMYRNTRPSPWKFVRYLLLALAVVVTDQASKWAVTQSLAYGSSVALAPFFNLVYVRNTGAAFSFLADQGGMQIALFGAIAVIVSLAIIVILWKNCGARALFCTALALMLGGAVGNLIDRFVDGSVVDFLDFYWSAYHWPAFNVADIAVCCGAAGVILESFLHKEND